MLFFYDSNLYVEKYWWITQHRVEYFLILKLAIFSFTNLYFGNFSFAFFRILEFMSIPIYFFVLKNTEFFPSPHAKSIPVFNLIFLISEKLF